MPSAEDYFKGMALSVGSAVIVQGASHALSGRNVITGKPSVNSQINAAQVEAIAEGSNTPMPAADNIDDVLMERIGNRQVNNFLESKTSGAYLPDQVAAKEALANARALGIAGEEAVGVGAKTRIPSLTGTAKYRIPDQLTSSTLSEVKNVRYQGLTRRLMDFHLYSQQTGRQFILYTRPNTIFSVPLQKLINNGNIINKPIPFK